MSPHNLCHKFGHNFLQPTSRILQVHKSIYIVFDLVHPLAFNCFLVFGPKDWFPNSIGIQCYHCLIHGIAPIRIFNYLLKTNGFYLLYHPNHMCIVTSCKSIILEILYKILNLCGFQYFNIVVKYFFKYFLTFELQYWHLIKLSIIHQGCIKVIKFCIHVKMSN
jgi:hypothetical protein